MLPTFVAQVAARDWITAAVIAVATILIRRLTKRRIRKKDLHAELIDFGGRLLSVLVLVAGAYYTLEALQVELGPVLGAFGIGALFVAVGLQPLLVNIVGSVVLQARRPFRRGDQILSNGYEGTVLDVTSTSTLLLSYNGETVHLPNGQVLSQPVTNWTHEPVRRSVLPISVSYDTALTSSFASGTTAIILSQPWQEARLWSPYTRNCVTLASRFRFRSLSCTPSRTPKSRRATKDLTRAKARLLPIEVHRNGFGCDLLACTRHGLVKVDRRTGHHA